MSLFHKDIFLSDRGKLLFTDNCFDRGSSYKLLDIF
ncbi:hypothetical protein EZS27_011857 [termite gut metagenome]|uniref:Uncharacterized protein n=1 Tax=termite gut metagenome TaxID=433724 RepID=A0A5J4S2F1_9ZZZZ